MTSTANHNLAIEAQYLRGDVLREGIAIETLIKHCGAAIVPSLVDAEEKVARYNDAIDAIQGKREYDGALPLALSDADEAELDRLFAAREIAIAERKAAYLPVRAKADEIDTGADTYFA